MALSIHLEPDLEARVEQGARRLGVSKSDFVKDALERTMGLKNPAELHDKVRTGVTTNEPGLSESVSARMKRKLRAKHTR